MSRAVGAQEAEHLAALDAYAEVAHGQLTWLGLGLGLGFGLGLGSGLGLELLLVHLVRCGE